MKYTKNEVMQYVIEEDVKFIRLAFCDVFGKIKNISIMPSELERAFEYGIAFDGSAISGFGDVAHSDLFLHPDPDTLSVLPWRPEHGRVVRMFCSITYPDGKVFENDCRSTLIRAIDDAEKAGLNFAFGAEIEFYLFRLDENGNPTDIPYDNAGYLDVAPEDKGENVRREICLTLERMGIKPESSHHEEGPGQNEIDFRYSDPLSAADNAITFISVVKTIAARNGLYADFSPRPIDDKPGSGCHINFSVKPTEGDAPVMPNIIAGVLDKISDMTLFLNPVAESYERLGSHKAPKYITWSAENRSQLVRIPAAYGEFKRAELRSPDPSSNPYLAYALIIYAGLYGLENKLDLPYPANLNLYIADSKTLAQYKCLPGSRTEAARKAAASSFIKSVLPEATIKAYTK